MKKLSRLQGVLGVAVSVIGISSCADPTDHRLYLELEDKKESLKTSIPEVRAELETLEEVEKVAEDEADEAASTKKSVESELAYRRSVRSSLIGEIEDKKYDLENKDLQLRTSEAELTELIEAYG